MTGQYEAELDKPGHVPGEYAPTDFGQQVIETPDRRAEAVFLLAIVVAVIVLLVTR